MAKGIAEAAATFNGGTEPRNAAQFRILTVPSVLQLGAPDKVSVLNKLVRRVRGFEPQMPFDPVP